MASRTIVLVGAGNMGGAMMRGWVKSGIDPATITVIDPVPSPAMAEFLADKAISHFASVPDGLKAAAVFIAVKPQLMAQVLPSLLPLLDDQTVCISIAAGTGLAQLSTLLGHGAIVRAMPNTPAMVGRAISAAIANDKVEWVDSEHLIDAVTAVSGSGPAYVFYLVECMAEAGRKAGLDRDLAMRLARATVSGAGELLFQSTDDAQTLRKNVTSPGGTTAAALDVLMRDDAMQGIFDEAIAAAKRRSIELAG